MEIKSLKDHTNDLAKKLADERPGSPAYKKLLARERKAYKSMGIIDPDFLDIFVQRAEKAAEAMRQDAAERGSLSRVAPMEGFAAINPMLEELSRRLDEKMKSMTFGVMPSKSEFKAAFKREVPNGAYVIKAGAFGAGEKYAGSYDADDLYDLVKDIKDDLSDDEDSGGSWASSIMSTLGFEWI